MKKLIVLSGINLYSGGTLSIYKDALRALVKENYDKKFRMIAFVYRKSLFSDIEGNIEYIEKPLSRKAYVFRLWYEYIYFYWFSVRRRVAVWISMHDITPNVKAECRYVYCHNPSIFYKWKLRDLYLAPKMVLFSLFYQYVYKINIKKNKAVIVQSKWLSRKFQELYGIRNVIAAYPRTDQVKMEEGRKEEQYLFLYPALPRVFKNFEIICEACRRLNQHTHNYQVIFTISGTENAYARYLKKKYGDIKEICWKGLLPREVVFKLYGKADCLIFPSKLESWGLPISEFEQTGKILLLADLEYAHETAGNYRKKLFFPPEDSVMLSSLMLSCMEGRQQYASGEVTEEQGQQPAASWKQLFQMLELNDESI